MDNIVSSILWRVLPWFCLVKYAHVCLELNAFLVRKPRLSWVSGYLLFNRLYRIPVWLTNYLPSVLLDWQVELLDSFQSSCITLLTKLMAGWTLIKTIVLGHLTRKRRFCFFKLLGWSYSHKLMLETRVRFQSLCAELVFLQLYLLTWCQNFILIPRLFYGIKNWVLSLVFFAQKLLIFLKLFNKHFWLHFLLLHIRENTRVKSFCRALLIFYVPCEKLAWVA